MPEPRAPITLALVRHGETEGESSIRYHGRNDVPLSDLGREQMRAVRREIERRFGSAKFTHLFTTPLSRAYESATIIAGRASGIVVIEEFIEVHFGLFEGLTADEIRERYPVEFETWNADRLAPAYTYPRGESRAEFAKRVERGLAQMVEQIDAEQGSEPALALLVAHRGVIRAIVRALTKAEPIVELGSIQILGRDREWNANLIDHVAHLRNI